MRVVSLVPSVTETLLAWGVEPVAVTRFCEQGERFPTVGGTKNPDIAAIEALRPDLVIVCDQENRRPDAEALTALGVTVHVIHITSIDHVGPEMARLAVTLGRPETLGNACAAPAVAGSAAQRRAFVPIWRRPWMTLNKDTYAMTLLSLIGIVGVADDDNNPYPEITLDEVRARGVDLVIAPNEPYEFGEHHRPELSTVAPVTFVDGKDLFWWGARTRYAVARLSDVLAHPTSRSES